MVNDKRFELSEVRSPLLNPDFGNGLEKQFENIDANFKKIATAEYLRGRSGTTTHCVTVKLDGSHELTGVDYKNGAPIQSYSLTNKLLTVIYGEQLNPAIIEEFNNSNYELILFIEDDNQGHKIAVSSMPFIYHDPELVDLLNNKDYQEQDFQDNSGIFLFNGDDFEKATSYPTLYYNKEIGEFCWIINGTETELVARGPQGAPGQNGTCLVVQIGKMIEVNTEDGQITTPFLYPVRAILFPDLEKGFTWKKLEDFTEDDPVTNYLHNDQIVIAIPNSGTEIELSNGVTYSAHTWACISPIVTRVGDMFESDSGTDYFCVYADYSNTISNVVTNSNLKWILRSVNTNSNDLKGLYVSNNPTSIDDIEYEPSSADYAATYFPNGVHMMHVDENNVLNFKHTTNPESTNKFGGDYHISHVNFDYNVKVNNLEANSITKVYTTNMSLGENTIKAIDPISLEITNQSEPTEVSTVSSKVKFKIVKGGKVTARNSSASDHYTFNIIGSYEDNVTYNSTHLYGLMKIGNDTTQQLAIAMTGPKENQGAGNYFLSCINSSGVDLLATQDADNAPNSNWKINDAFQDNSYDYKFFSTKRISNDNNPWGVKLTITSVNIEWEEIILTLNDIGQNGYEWINEEDGSIYYSQTKLRVTKGLHGILQYYYLLPKTSKGDDFGWLVGYVTESLDNMLVESFTESVNPEFAEFTNTGIYGVDVDTFRSRWLKAFTRNIQSIYSTYGILRNNYGLIENRCQSYTINGIDVLKTIDDIKEKLNTLSGGVAAISYNNEPAYDGEVYTEPAYNGEAYNGEAYNGEETVNLDEMQNTILTIQNQLDSISNQIPLMIAESMENDEAVQNAISNRILYTMRNNASVSKAIDSKVSASLNDTNSTTYKTMKQQVSNVISTDSNVSDSLSNVVVNSIQTNTNVQNQIKVQTKSALNEDSSKSIIKDVVNNAILNDDTTQLNIENYISDLLVTESQLNNNITQAVMKVANTQAFKNALITSLKDVMVTKEEFNQYINTEVNITDGDSNLS